MCSTVDVKLQIVEAWDHIVNLHVAVDRSVYERSLNFFVFFGRMNSEALLAMYSGPASTASFGRSTHIVIHVGHYDFREDCLGVDFVQVQVLPRQEWPSAGSESCAGVIGVI